MDQNTTSPNLMVHRTAVIDAGSRIPFLIGLLKGKRVLHVGCTDYPRFDPNNNLHVILAAQIDYLHGYDIDREGIEVLARYVSKPLFHSHDQIRAQTYDLVLIPEVIEHVINPGLFLKEMMDLDTRDIVLLAPNAIETVKHNAPKFGWERSADGAVFYRETVHNDHVCFYTPKTLATLVEKSIATYHPNRWMLGPMFACDISVGCILRRTGNCPPRPT